MTQGYFFILQDTVKGNRSEIKRASVTELTTVEIALRNKKKLRGIEALYSLV